MRNSAPLAILLAVLVTGCGMMAREPAPPPYAGAPLAGGFDDVGVTTRVRKALAEAPELDHTRINVDTRNARVFLRGEIKSMPLRKRAEAVVRSVPGVRAVENELIITG